MLKSFNMGARPGGKFERAGVWAIALCVLLFYFDAARTRRAYTRPAEGSYYNLLAAGFVAGHLGLDREPSPELAALADPYDPVKRAQSGANDGLLDITYYKGRFYLYFGVAPELVLFLPYRLLTGHYFPQNLGIALFCALGYVASIGCFLRLRRRFFPECGTPWVWLGTLLLGLGNLCPVMLVRSEVWEVPIAAAYGFSSLGFWCLLAAFESSPRPAWLLAGASTAFGLAAASRPHFVLGAVALSALWIWCQWKERKTGFGPGVWREGAALLLPVGGIGVGLLLYNYARFDSPFEFGVKYMLGSLDATKTAMTSLRYVPINFFYNFLTPVHLSRYFPFFQGISFYPGPQPVGYFGFEYPIGLLTSLPFSWLAVAAPVIWWRTRRSETALGGWLLAFALFFAAVTAEVLCFVSAANRYMVDFLPTVLMLASIGLLMVGRGIGSGPLRWLTKGLAVAAVLGTAALVLSVTFRFFDYYRIFRPATYHTLARWMDQPAAWWEAASRPDFGPMQLTVRLPSDRIGAQEPLVVAGTPEYSDYFFLHYVDPTHVRIGFSHQRESVTLSQPIPVDYSVPHEITLEAGTFYPPAEHPYFSGRTPAEVAAARGTLRMMVDGIPYFVGAQVSAEVSPASVEIGKNSISTYAGGRFHGEILRVERKLLANEAPPAFAGKAFLRLALKLDQLPVGIRQPLVMTGRPEAADLLFVIREADNRVRLGYHHTGREPELSDALVVEPGTLALVDASLGSFYPDPANTRERELAQSLVVRLNGAPVWDENRTFHPPGQANPLVGESSLGAGFAAARFAGEIVARESVQFYASAPDQPYLFSPYWVEAGPGPQFGGVRLQVQLPTAGSAGRSEPLLVTGPGKMQADYLWINYVDVPRRVMLGYEHTGGGGPKTGAVPVAFARPHVIEISMPSLYPVERDALFADRTLKEIAAMKSRLLVRVDGEVRLDSRVPSWGSQEDQITPGESRVSEVFGRRFSGKILAVERSTFAAPQGFARNSGPVELALWFPGLSEGREVLLATGNGTATDVLGVEYRGAKSAVFTFQPAQGAGVIGQPVEIDRGIPHKIAVNWGAFASAPRRSFRILLDGRPVLEGQADFAAGIPLRVDLGGDAVRNARAFSGRIISVQRLPVSSP